MSDNMLNERSAGSTTEYVYDYVAHYYPLSNSRKREIAEVVAKRDPCYNSTQIAIRDAERVMKYVPCHWVRRNKEYGGWTPPRNQVMTGSDYVIEYIIKHPWLVDSGERAELKCRARELYPGYKDSTINDAIANAIRIRRVLERYWEKVK